MNVWVKMGFAVSSTEKSVTPEKCYINVILFKSPFPFQLLMLNENKGITWGYLVPA